jgi:hypothetical protein
LTLAARARALPGSRSGPGSTPLAVAAGWQSTRQTRCLSPTRRSCSRSLWRQIACSTARACGKCVFLFRSLPCYVHSPLAFPDWAVILSVTWCLAPHCKLRPNHILFPNGHAFAPISFPNTSSHHYANSMRVSRPGRSPRRCGAHAWCLAGTPRYVMVTQSTSSANGRPSRRTWSFSQVSLVYSAIHNVPRKTTMPWLMVR